MLVKFQKYHFEQRGRGCWNKLNQWHQLTEDTKRFVITVLSQCCLLKMIERSHEWKIVSFFLYYLQVWLIGIKSLFFQHSIHSLSQSNVIQYFFNISFTQFSYKSVPSVIFNTVGWNKNVSSFLNALRILKWPMSKSLFVYNIFKNIFLCIDLITWERVLVFLKVFFQLQIAAVF